MLSFSACMIGPKYQRPSVTVPQSYGEALPAGWKPSRPGDSIPRGKWWEAYHDPALNALEEQVSISNQNVLAAEAQYREALEAIRIARASLFPTAGTSLSISGSHTPAAVNPLSTGASALYSIPVAISYQADVWGSIRRAVAANRATAQATAAQLENARLLYQSDLAADYFQYRGALNVRQLLTDTVKSYEQYLQLTRDRYASGVASMGDVAQAQTQLETTRSALTDLGVQIAQLRHAIAVLAGKPPAGFSIPPHPLPQTPPEIPIALPSTLLERRPDIAAIERQVAAANEQIGIAQASLYPAISLSAGGGSETAAFLKLLTASSYFWSAGGQLAQTLFDRGRRRAQISLTKAAYDAIASNYRQTVLTAFQQVEDELAALRILAGEAAVQERAVAASQQSLQISTAQYQGGVQSYLQVITSQTFALQNRVSAVGIQTRRMVASVLLIQALGGGWDTSQLPVT
ncbi:MAG: efflux transporter outer membrane subunit [Bryobacterales bacterium]|nr:efflux transporter outer membrane subunit [Bryobacterales bacterium]